MQDHRVASYHLEQWLWGGWIVEELATFVYVRQASLVVCLDFYSGITNTSVCSMWLPFLWHSILNSLLLGEIFPFLLFVQYAKFVKPAFDDFILPSKKYADVIIPRGGDNHVAIDLIVQHIHTKLGQHDLCKIYPNVTVIQSTFQV